MSSISASKSTARAILQWTIENCISHPWEALVAIITIICLTTRIVSGLKFRRALTSNSHQTSRPNTNTSGQQSTLLQTVPTLPYWIPWLGHAISFTTGVTSFLGHQTRLLGTHSGIFALKLGGTKHNIVTIPSLAQQILNDLQPDAPTSMKPFIIRALKYVWADRGSLGTIDPPSALWGDIHAVMSSMLREKFLGPALKRAVAAVEERTWNLVSEAQSPVDQSVWEREANVVPISGIDGGSLSPAPQHQTQFGGLVAEANLHTLIRYFVGDIASTILFGRDFMDNNPRIMQDLWEMDSRFNLFMAGMPGWFPGMRSASMARERVIHAVQEHHDALYRYLDGNDPGYRWTDMSDVSSVIVDRALALRKANASPRAYGALDTAVLWAMNVNANQVIFWLLWHVYSESASMNLLADIRAELAPYVKLRKPETRGLINEAPKLEIVDLDALWTKCPLLKGAFFESMRLESQSVSYKEVLRDFVVTESLDDAGRLGRPDGHQESWLLRKGEFVCIPHGVHQTDPKYFADPEKFDPRRFWTKINRSDGTDNGTGKESHSNIRVDYGTMRVFGGGRHICKGKTFAEREVVLFAAAILMQWDMTPVDNNGRWVHPGTKPGIGTLSPLHDVSVRLSRREEW
ncbi:cytochrome P450 [Exophiala dermatitidis NIH/UT8656]|uniref:Cytochrome P450 n=2 Tax=Exophiala dermatitidis TaxID=5970 RepID=H6BW90_EXODN|nr:cytochrome P450 [Exophiala dermatitidis NIH/UT8656]EHY55191.1 cytochrome P450 [Exophiala dermatitidis NIH/UT8656]